MDRIETLTDAIYTRHNEDPEFDGIFGWVGETLEDLMEESEGEACECCIDKHGLYLSTWGLDWVNLGVRARLRMCEDVDLEDYTDEEIGMAVFPILVSEWGPIVHYLLSDEASGPPAGTQLN
jgi:hypothetical protein